MTQLTNNLPTGVGRLTKKNLREIMLQVIDDQDNTHKDEWYTTHQTFARFGIELLAKELKIDLELGEEYD